MSTLDNTLDAQIQSLTRKDPAANANNATALDLARLLKEVNDGAGGAIPTPSDPQNADGIFYNSTTEAWEAKPTRYKFPNGLNIFQHRGVQAYGAPENSLIALYHANCIGATLVEMDVQHTLDGEFVILHDDTINSQFTLVNGDPIPSPININDITLADAQSLYRYDSEINGYKGKIATLDDFLRDCVRYGIRPMMELKYANNPSLDTALLALTRKYFLDEDIIMYSIDDDVMIRFAGISNYYPVFFSGNIALASEYRGGVLVLYTTVDQTMVDQCADLGVDIYAYTPNAQEELNTLTKMGVRNILSDVFAPDQNEILSHVQNYNSDLTFLGCTTVIGGVTTVITVDNENSESLVTLLNIGDTLKSPIMNMTRLGAIDAEFVLSGAATIQLYENGSLRETITSTGSTVDGFRIMKLVNLSSTFYVIITAAAANVEVTAMKIQSSRVTQSGIRGDNGIGINFNPNTDKFAHLKGSTFPNFSTWDSSDQAGFVGVGETSNIEFMAGVASDTAALKTAFIGKRSRGTLATPSDVVSGDAISGLFGGGYQGGTFRNHGSVEFVVSGPVSSGTVPMAISFQTGVTTRAQKMWLGSLGGLGLGALQTDTTVASYNFRDTKNIGGVGSTILYGHVVDGAIQTDIGAGGEARIFQSNPSTVGAAGVIIHFQARQQTFGGAVTTQYGFAAQSSLIGATTNYGFHANIAAAASNWNFYAQGTAQNYFLGNVGIGSGKTVPAYAVDVNGRVDATSFGVAGVAGVSGTITAASTVTVVNGIITVIA